MIRATTPRLRGLCVCVWEYGGVVPLFAAIFYICYYTYLFCSILWYLSCSFRDVPKPKRRVPPRQKEKKEKEKAPKKEKEVAEIKIEGSDNLERVEEEVKLEEEIVEDPDGPRK